MYTMEHDASSVRL